MNKFTRWNGAMIQNFDWGAHASKPGGEVFAAMARAHTGLRTLVEDGVARRAELEQDRNFTPAGRRDQARQWLTTNGPARFAEARLALEAAQAAIEQTRSGLEAAPIDRTDAAGAVVRSDLRRWLAGLDHAKRGVMVAMGQLPPDAVAAIMEAPAELSGLTEDAKRRVELGALKARYPERFARMAAIDEAVEALVSMKAAAVKALGAGRDIVGDLSQVEKVREQFARQGE